MTKPTAAKGAFPYTDHRTVADVDFANFLRRPQEMRNMCLEEWLEANGLGDAILHLHPAAISRR